MKKEDYRDHLKRKSQFEEEIKVARLTQVSKNTNTSANSLEYSPSPKRPIASNLNSPGEINESPIKV